MGIFQKVAIHPVFQLVFSLIVARFLPILTSAESSLGDENHSLKKEREREGERRGIFISWKYSPTGLGILKAVKWHNQ